MAEWILSDKDIGMDGAYFDYPELIRCKDCKWYGRVDKRRFYRGMDCLQKHIDTIVPDRDFCSKAERRGEPMSDLISRQAAIEIVDRYNKSHMILKGKPMLGAASIVIELEELPSAQPEIIRCKDCKHKHIKDNVWTCPFGLPAGCDFYCGYGERKTE